MNRIYKIIFTLSLVLLCASAYADTGSVYLDKKYAWGDKIGWINFAPTNSNGDYAGLIITDESVTGLAWSKNYGWINFGPINGKVTIKNKEGVLEGYAWSQSLGWIDLTGVSINKNGDFVGKTRDLGNDAGQINFDCSECRVNTNWRLKEKTENKPVAEIPTPVPSAPIPSAPVPPSPSNGGGGGGGGGIINIPSMPVPIVAGGTLGGSNATNTIPIINVVKKVPVINAVVNPATNKTVSPASIKAVAKPSTIKTTAKGTKPILKEIKVATSSVATNKTQNKSKQNTSILSKLVKIKNKLFTK